MKLKNGFNMKKEIKVYLPMAADLIHNGHINIIKKASELGQVTVGLLTDKAVAKYKRVPFLTFEQRKFIAENIVGVYKVIPQADDDYVSIIRKFKPDYFVHGDDWKEGPQKNKRKRVIEVMKEWGGVVIEPEYTKDISSTQLHELIKEIGTTPDIRRRKLKRLIDSKPIVRILEAHSGLSGLVVESTKVSSPEGVEIEFDGMWASSLTDSTLRGKPDIEAVDLTSRLTSMNDILEVTTKPIIYDGDTGGKPEHLTFTVKTLERLGVSAIIIEDKIGLKKNSLFGIEVDQQQDSIESFCDKIETAKKAQVTSEFMVVARIESLILQVGMKDALKRAKAYINSGADGIMIHSREKTPDEIFEFCVEYKKFKSDKPLIVVPSSYNKTKEQELIDHGVKVVIYANQLLRSSYPSMIKTAESILKNSRSYESTKDMMSIKEILNLIPGGK
jgi:phosphoenolpyruvate phosphomutase